MDEFIGIVKLFGGTFAPVGWLPCDGRLLPISQYDTLYALLGTTYGGDGVQTFALPDLRSAVAVGTGRSYQPGNVGGSDTVTLTISQLPNHSHSATMSADNIPATSPSSGTNMALAQSSGTTAGGEPLTTNIYSVPGAGGTVALHPSSVGNVTPSGGGQPHNNMQPFLGMMYCICVEGIWPSQS